MGFLLMAAKKSAIFFRIERNSDFSKI